MEQRGAVVRPIKRLGRSNGGNLEFRVGALEGKVAEMSAKSDEMHLTLTEVRSDTSAILSALKGATKFGAFVKKHGPRAFAFAMGVLVTSGYISPEMAKHFAILLGF